MQPSYPYPSSARVQYPHYPNIQPSAPDLSMNLPSKVDYSSRKLWKEKPKTDEEKDAFLKRCDFIILIDRSKSMKWKDKGESDTRWQKVQEIMSFIVQAATDYDSDGVDVCLYGTETKWFYNVESEETVEDIFTKYPPDGTTNLTKALKQTRRKHRKLKVEKADGNKKQHTCVLVITDGKPNSKKDVKKEIVSITKSIDSDRVFKQKDRKSGEIVKTTDEIGIRFFQVGKDRGATTFLETLDDDLEGACADIVDTGSLEELNSNDSVTEAFINAFWD